MIKKGGNDKKGMIGEPKSSAFAEITFGLVGHGQLVGFSSQRGKRFLYKLIFEIRGLKSEKQGPGLSGALGELNDELIGKSASFVSLSHRKSVHGVNTMAIPLLSRVG